MQFHEALMKRRSPLLVLAALAGLSLLACGSGGGNVPPGGGAVTPVFTPDTMAPGANSITMAAGTVNGDAFQVVIQVNDITDFFGAAFRVRFDSATTEYQSFDASGSILQMMAPNLTINAAPDANDADVVIIVATLQGFLQGLDTSAGPHELITLTFRATGATGGNNFSFDTAMTRLVTTCPAPPGVCTDLADAALTWNEGVLTAS